MSEALIRVDDLSIAYASEEGPVQALRHATLEARAGEAIGIVGESGCGKSTIMKLVTGLLPPTGGEVRVNGTKVTGPIKGVGMAFQNPTLMPWRMRFSAGPIPDNIRICGDCSAPAHSNTSRAARNSRRWPSWTTSTPTARRPSNRTRVVCAPVNTCRLGRDRWGVR